MFFGLLDCVIMNYFILFLLFDSMRLETLTVYGIHVIEKQLNISL